METRKWGWLDNLQGCSRKSHPMSSSWHRAWGLTDRGFYKPVVGLG